MILTVLFLAIKPSGASVDPVIEQFLLNDQTLEMRVLPTGKATTGPDAFGASASHAQNIDWQLTDYSRDAFTAASGLLAFHFIDTTQVHQQNR